MDRDDVKNITDEIEESVDTVLDEAGAEISADENVSETANDVKEEVASNGDGESLGETTLATEDDMKAISNGITEEIFSEDEDELDPINNIDQKTEKDEPEGRYTDVIVLDENLWTYGSPVIFEHGAMQYDNVTGKNVLCLTFTNIDKRTIRDLAIIVYVSDAGGHAEKVEYEYSALNLKYMMSKGSNVKIPIGSKTARKFRIKVDGISFREGGVWTKKEAMYESYGEIENLQEFAEDMANDYETKFQQARELIDKDDVESITDGINAMKSLIWYRNAEDVIKTARKKCEAAKKIAERKSRNESSAEQRKKAVRKRYFMVAVIAVAAILAGIGIFKTVIVPKQNYDVAVKNLEDGNYEKAIKQLTVLNGYKDSYNYISEAYYKLALDALDKGKEDDALEYFTKGYNVSKNTDYGKMNKMYKDYYSGENAMQKGEYDDAIAYFESCMNAASDFNLVNKAGSKCAEMLYTQHEYEQAWTYIKNVYAKDESYADQYAEYGLAYAKALIDEGKVDDGLKLYNDISSLAKDENVYQNIYDQAVKLAEGSKVEEAMDVLDKIRKNHKESSALYEKMYAFHQTALSWIGTWTHKGKVSGENKTFTMVIDDALYKGEMCLKIKDVDNDILGYDTVLSKDKGVRYVAVDEYNVQFAFPEKGEKVYLSRLENNELKKKLIYAGETYETVYKRNK